MSAIHAPQVMPPLDRAVSPILLAAEPRGRLRQVLSWLLVAALILGVHGGLLWLLVRDTTVERPLVTEEAGAVMIDLAPEIQQAASKTDAAIGQRQAEAAPPDEAPPPPPPDVVPDPTPKIEDSPAPPVAPLPPKPDEVPPKVEKQKPPPPKPKTPTKPPAKPVPRKPIKPHPSSSAATAQAASAPRSDFTAAATTATSAGVASAADVADWKSQVAAALNRHKRFPSGVDDTGVPTVKMFISASGEVTGASIVSSSGSGELDQAALDTVYRSSPLPEPPSGATAMTFRMNFHRR